MAPKKDTTPSKKKDKYRIRNWRQYNQSLVNRGSITFWFDEAAIAKWDSVDRSDKPGRPETYSDDTIRCGILIIDFTDHERPQNHLNPHQHEWIPNPTGGTRIRNPKGQPVTGWNYS